jgi:hypothetical protein
VLCGGGLCDADQLGGVFLGCARLLGRRRVFGARRQRLCHHAVNCLVHTWWCANKAWQMVRGVAGSRRVVQVGTGTRTGLRWSAAAVSAAVVVVLLKSSGTDGGSAGGGGGQAGLQHTDVEAQSGMRLGCAANKSLVQAW